MLNNLITFSLSNSHIRLSTEVDLVFSRISNISICQILVPSFQRCQEPTDDEICWMIEKLCICMLLVVAIDDLIRINDIIDDDAHKVHVLETTHLDRSQKIGSIK